MDLNYAVDLLSRLGHLELYQEYGCGCVRSYSVSIGLSASETVSACKKHKDLVR